MGISGQCGNVYYVKYQSGSMSEFKQVADIPGFAGKDIALRGWIHRTRGSKGIRFLVLRDSSGVVQCVVKEGAKGFEDAVKALMESSVELKGVVREDKRAPTGFEVDVTELKVVGFAENFPIRKDQSPELLLDQRHLWVRSRKLTDVFKIRSVVFGAIHEFFRERGFFEIQSPSLTKSACEGGSTLFEVKYFKEKAFLTQSWQLYAEALIAGLEKIYCIAPSFRAEKSRTRRHLAEYWHAEAEVAWIGQEGTLKLQEELISFVVKKVLEKRGGELKALGRDVKILEKVKPPFQRITYKEAVDMLRKDGMDFKEGQDFGIDEEKVLTNHFDKPFFVTDFPKKIKAFYMKESPDNPTTVLCDDCYAPEGYGEIIGGSVREESIDKLLENIKKEGADPKGYEWYLDTRKFGSVPHAGFGLGVERLVMWICGLDHIRDTIAFPRVMNRLYP